MGPDFHPIVARWFERRFGEPTEPQALAWPEIEARRDVLVSAPTGSGKTLAAFLSAIDRLFRDALAGRLADETRVLYVSPLRALVNDVDRNLQVPLTELALAARAEGLSPPEVRVALRTGDTTPARRQALVRRPPHVLETVAGVALPAPHRRARARAARHGGHRDRGRDPRGGPRQAGSPPSLSPGRLEAITPRRPQRIGLSATQNPVEEIARFLVGSERVDRSGKPRCRTR